MSAVDLVIARLLSALGTGETPPNSNWNHIVEWYNDVVQRIGRGPWCQMTVTWAFFTALPVRLIKGRAYTVWAAQDFIRGELGGTWHWGTAGMRRGDVVYYDWTARKGNVGLVDHVGTVEKIVGNGTFYVLEGNNNANRLARMLRDSKFVVGYGRPDWSRVPAPKPGSAIPPKLPSTSKRNPTLVRAIQSALELLQDGEWGPDTDEWAMRLRTAARAKAGYPRKVAKAFKIAAVQKVIDTTADDQWGPKSQARLVVWVKDFQRRLGVPQSGRWDAATDNAFLAARARNHNKH